jgi:RNA polymerase sigma-70 factor (ECF subfamily)
MLRGLGIPEDQSDHIAIDHSQAVLPAADKALLDFALKLATRPAQFGLPDIAGLRNRGFSDEQILEAVVMSALTNFLNTLQMGLGTVADFPPRPAALGLNLSPPPERPMLDTGAHRPGEDPDAGLVERVRNGDFEAFEQIVRRHQGRVYRTLMGVTGNAQDAEDGTQNVFIKVFRKIADFQGAARFSTWLTRIALNEAAERLRTRKDLDRLDERDEEEFRPSRLQPWAEDPESRVAREEMKQIVQEALRRLPVRYRTAVMLRDIEELSTAEAAEALGVPVPTLKTRLLRGRLMLREALAARFIVPRRQTVV